MSSVNFCLANADTAIALAIALPAATELLKEGDYSIGGDLICSGEDPAEESGPFSPAELEELPEFLRELVVASRAATDEDD